MEEKSNILRQGNTKHELKRGWEFPFSKVKKGSRIILYGAGEVGRDYYNQIMSTNYCEIVSWIDKRYLDYRSFGFAVDDVTIPQDDVFDYVVIAVSEYSSACDIFSYLNNQMVAEHKIIWGVDERLLNQSEIKEKRLVRPMQECVTNALVQRGVWTGSGYGKSFVKLAVETSRKGFVIPRLVVELTTACTLKCKHCNNLIPQLKARNVDLDKTKECIQNIAKAADSIAVLELIGGEPLLYPHLKQVLDFVLSIGNVFEIEITTNGTIIPDKDLLVTLRNPKVVVHISQYESSSKVGVLEKIFTEENVRYICMKEMVWVDSGGVESRHRSEEQIKNEYENCFPSYTCKTLFDGKIYACARSASLYEMGVLDDPAGYVEIDNRDSLRDDLNAFWLKLSDKACDHCDAAHLSKQIKAGEQLDSEES